MRIDLIITELPVGGAERCLTEIAVGLKQRGHTPRVLTLGPPPRPPRDGLLQRLQAAGVPWESAETTSKSLAPLALNRLRRMLLRDKPELVQTFLFHANVLGTAAAAMAGVPVCVGGIRVAQPRRLRVWLERHFVRKMEAVVCVSQAVADFAKTDLAVPQAKLQVIPNAVDVERFAGATPVDWRRHDMPRDAAVGLFVGRFDPQKGLERLFAAAPEWLVADPRRWLVLVGDGPQREWCCAQCLQLPEQRGRVLAWQPDVAPLMQAAQVFLLTSRYEGMPNVVLEAMAAGKPVVTTAVEGVDELLRHQTERQVVPQGDVSAIAAAATYWLDHPEAAAAAGQANQAIVRQDFSPASMVDRYEQLYRSLTGR